MELNWDASEAVDAFADEHTRVVQRDLQTFFYTLKKEYANTIDIS
jgi:hypothetical protein